MELHVHWCLVQNAEAGGPRSTLGGSEFDLSDIDLPHAAIAAGLQVGFNEGLASYLTWLFSHPDEPTRTAVLSKAQRDAVAPPASALWLTAAALEFLYGIDQAQAATSDKAIPDR